MRSFFLFAVFSLLCFRAAGAGPLPVAAPNLTRAVNFESEILPFLKESCLACHNQTRAKAELVLETPQTILKGGESGPAVIPGNPQESLLFKVAAHLDKPFMPPADNKVNAANLSAEQLGLLQLWILQGASGEVHGDRSIAWRPLPAKVRPILALALTDDGQFAACGRGNELSIYHIPTGRTIGPFVDPALSQSREGESRAAHLDLIQSLDFSPDGELLASAGYREVKLWRRSRAASAKQPLADLLGRSNEPFRMVTVSPTGERVATLSTTHKLHVWSLGGERAEHEFQLESTPDALSWVGDQTLVAAISTNLQVWHSGRQTFQTFTNEPVVTAALCGVGTQLAVAERNGVIRLFNLETGEGTPVFTNQSLVFALAGSRDGKLLAVAGEDKAVRVINLAESNIVQELRGDYRTTYRIAQVERALIRSRMHEAYRKGRVEQAGKEGKTQVERVRKASESAGNAEKALAGQREQVKAAQDEEAAAQKELQQVQAKLKEAKAEAEKALAELKRSKEAVRSGEAKDLESKLEELAARAAAAALATNLVAELTPETEKNEKPVQEKIKAAQKKIADAEALLKRGLLTNAAAENELHFAITSAHGAFAELTDSQNHLQTAEADRKSNELLLDASKTAFTKSLSPSLALAFSADGTLLAAGGGDRTVTVWSVKSGAALDTIQVAYEPSCVAFTGENTLITWAPGQANGWQFSAPWKLERVIAMVKGEPAFADRVNSVRFSPDGQFLATGGGEPSRSGEVKVWRAKDGQFVREFQGLHSDTVLALAFSPDGRYLASGGADRFAKVTDMATGKLVRALEGHTHHVLSLGWKADGHTLATGGADNLIKLWDALSGEKKKSPEPLGKEVSAIAFLSDTDQIMAASGDGSLRLIKENGEKVRSFDGANGFIQAAVTSPGGGIVAAGGQDGVLRVWQVETGKLLREFAP